MLLSVESKKNLETELVLTATRSSGPGGQNVNKVNTRVELRFSIGGSVFLTPEEKELIRKKLVNRINLQDELILSSEEKRSQLGNKEVAIHKFFLLIESALKPRKKRIKTNPGISSKLKRLEAKKLNAEKKFLRKPPGL
jgi:ribosome-associated protein